LLREGKFDEARASFVRASRVFGTWKLRGVALLAGVAPRLLQRLAGGRLDTQP
jgi:hypothetical protein